MKRVIAGMLVVASAAGAQQKPLPTVEQQIDSASLRVLRALCPGHDWSRRRTTLRKKHVLSRLASVRFPDRDVVACLIAHSRHDPPKFFLKRRVESGDRPFDAAAARYRVARRGSRPRVVARIHLACVVGAIGIADIARVAGVINLIGLIGVRRRVEL